MDLGLRLETVLELLPVPERPSDTELNVFAEPVPRFMTAPTITTLIKAAISATLSCEPIQSAQVQMALSCRFVSGSIAQSAAMKMTTEMDALIAHVWGS